MTPKQKANDLAAAYWSIIYEIEKATLLLWMEGREKYGVPLAAKKCALLAVDEIDAAVDFDDMEIQNLDREHVYWQQVKEELEKL